MKELAKHTRIEKLLLEAARTLNSTLEYEELNQLVLKLVSSAVESEAAAIFRIDDKRKEMRIRFMKSDNGEVYRFDRVIGSGIVGWVLKNEEAAIIPDASEDSRVDREFEQETGLTFHSVVALPLIVQGRMIGVIAAINKLEGLFEEQDLEILTGLNHQIAVAIENAHVYREMKREALEKNLLYETGIKLSSKLSLNEVLNAILESLKQVVGYTVGGVYLTDDACINISEIFSVGYKVGSEKSLKMKCGQGLIGASVASAEPIIVPDVTKDDRYIMNNQTTKSEIVVPILVDGRVVGVINLESDQPEAYSEHECSLVTAFASQAGISLERVKIHESNLEARKLDEQLNVAREIQRSFLPDSNPNVPGYDIAGRNRPSGQVGGDYYDFIDIVGGHTGIAIADVSGKGIPASLIMASFRASLIAEIRNNYSIRTIGEKVNALMYESLEAGNYVTGVYGVLDSRNHIFTFANFGHNPPILLRKTGEVEYLSEGGLILGVTKRASFEERALLLNPGDIIVLYTDGVTEVFGNDSTAFDIDRLVQVIKANCLESSSEIADAIQEAVTDYAAEDHFFDDVTMIVLKREE